MRDSFDPEYLTPHQVAQLLGVSYKTVMRYIRSRKLPATQMPVNRGHWRVKADDYEAFARGERSTSVRHNYVRRSA